MKKNPDKNTRQFLLIRGLALAAFCITLLFALFIFIESLLPGDVSAKQSAFFARILSKNSLDGNASTLDSSFKTAAFFPNPKTNPHLFTRKFLGHFSCFFIYGILLALTALFLAKRKGLFWIYSAAAGVMSAGCSELLQLDAFTYGRDANLKDVGIDCVGLVCGIAALSLCALIVCLILNRRHKLEVFKRTNFHTVFVNKDIGVKLVFFDEN